MAEKTCFRCTAILKSGELLKGDSPESRIALTSSKTNQERAHSCGSTSAVLLLCRRFHLETALANLNNSLPVLTEQVRHLRKTSDTTTVAGNDHISMEVAGMEDKKVYFKM